MAKGWQVLKMLCPNVEYTIDGENFDSIVWNNSSEAITKAEFEAGFAQFDSWKAEQETEAEAKKKALLDRLGITNEEAKLLLS
jgi:hypothetical protein